MARIGFGAFELKRRLVKTVKPQGVGFGLGLAICKKLIEANGGRIEVASDGVPGRGSLFTHCLPVYEAR